MGNTIRGEMRDTIKSRDFKMFNVLERGEELRFVKKSRDDSFIVLNYIYFGIVIQL